MIEATPATGLGFTAKKRDRLLAPVLDLDFGLVDQLADTEGSVVETAPADARPKGLSWPR